jgi:hypothetical protein
MHILDTDTLTHLHAGYPLVLRRVLAASDSLGFRNQVQEHQY